MKESRPSELNGMPGGDLAQALVDQLPECSIETFEEDWGWMLLTEREGRLNEVAIYPENYDPEAEGWTLHVRSSMRGKVLGFVPAVKPCALDSEFVTDLRAAIAELGGIEIPDPNAD